MVLDETAFVPLSLCRDVVIYPKWYKQYKQQTHAFLWSERALELGSEKASFMAGLRHLSLSCCCTPA